MSDVTPISVIGSPAEAWLTASMLARFAPLSPTQIIVRELANTEDEPDTLIVRPEMQRLHASLGLDLRRIAAAPVRGWPAGDKREIPFGQIGAPYKGVQFSSLWQRANAQAAETRPLLDYTAANSDGAYAVTVWSYARALKTIATGVGVREGSVADGKQIAASRGVDIDENADTIRIGVAAVPVRLAPAFTLLALEKSVHALIDCWPWNETDQKLCFKEFQRRMTSIGHSINHMQALLLDEPPYSEDASDLQYRIALWRRAARIAPVDNDLFETDEWIAAMVLSGHQPEGGERLARSLTIEEIKAHLDACTPQEVINAE